MYICLFWDVHNVSLAFNVLSLPIKHSKEFFFWICIYHFLSFSSNFFLIDCILIHRFPKYMQYGEQTFNDNLWHKYLLEIYQAFWNRVSNHGEDVWCLNSLLHNGAWSILLNSHFCEQGLDNKKLYVKATQVI